MSFAGASERLQAAVFARLGEDAEWSGVGTVRVRRREYDEEDRRLEGGVELLTVRFIRVRRSEVPAPSQGDTAQILGDDGEPVPGAFYRVNGEPDLNRKGVWRCPVELDTAG